ncbi:FAD-dependent monooxygenase [Gluconacetobacter takamatsuzukensis]|uniref:FAD-dependent monooxygenase n=1 Tax=Gluconacetobacter takamatsuzukensis TaxID=1286190 RepID=UPI003083F37D
MHKDFSKCHDVVIAGAGPVGLFLAGELALAGCSVLVLEQAPQAGSPLKDLPFGLRGLSAATMDSLDRRDLLAVLQARGADRDIPATAHWMQQGRRPAGHFAGIPFFHDRIDSATWPYRLPGPTGGMASDMTSIETVLAQRATAMGAEIRRGCGVETVTQSETGIGIRTSGGTVEARWLVGCDGGRSTVRKAAGIGFTGTAPELTGYAAEVELADPDKLKPGRHHTATGLYTYAPPSLVAMVDFDGGAFHRTQPVTRDHIQVVLRKVSGTDVTVTALRLATTWTDRACQATDYRRGRIMLAGDAAHIHAPLGGQGLNLGLGDAINLGWKLAATIRGDAPPGLLDSYAAERHPVGAQVLDWSRAQVALMRPDPGARALAAIIRDLVETRDGASYCAGRVWGTGLRHDLGGTHPLVGQSAPDFALADGTRLNERLRTGRGLFLDFAARPSRQALAARWTGQVDYIASDAQDRLGLSAILVRPDGLVAWAGDHADDDEQACQAGSRWFATPSRPGTPQP